MPEPMQTDDDVKMRTYLSLSQMVLQMRQVMLISCIVVTKCNTVGGTAVWPSFSLKQ